MERRAVEIAPFRSALYYNRAQVRKDVGDLDGVQKDAATIVELADTYYIEKRSEEAQRLCRQAVFLDGSLKEDPVVKKILGGK